MTEVLNEYDEIDALLLARAEDTELPHGIIKEILLYIGCKNYLTIYQECLKEFMTKVQGTSYLYHVDATHIRTVEYMLRYNIQRLLDDGIDEYDGQYDGINLIFYFCMTGDKVSFIKKVNYEIMYDNVINQLVDIINLTNSTENSYF
jgi:hypothetical protein